MAGIKQKFPEYLNYLEDIKQRIRGLVVVFIIFFTAGFFGSGKILKLIVGLFKIEDANIVTTSPFQFLNLAMDVGIYTGLIICFPLFIYHLYDFLKDSLSRKEKRVFYVLLPIGLILFAIGFTYGFGVLYYALGSIASINISLGISNFWDINKFLSQIILTSALLGLIFQYPIVLTFLIKTRVITPALLKEKRRIAVALMFGLTALLPPTDGLSLIIMVVPLILIYEATILINSYIINKQLTN